MNSNNPWTGNILNTNDTRLLLVVAKTTQNPSLVKTQLRYLLQSIRHSLVNEFERNVYQDNDNFILRKICLFSYFSASYTRFIQISKIYF